MSPWECLQWRRNRRFRQINEPDLPSSWAPEWGHTCTVHAGDVIREHKKHRNPWRLGDPTWGAYIAPQALSKAPPPLSALRASSFHQYKLLNFSCILRTYKLQFHVCIFWHALRILHNKVIENTSLNHQFHHLTGKQKMFNVTVAAKFSTHAKIKYTEL